MAEPSSDKSSIAPTPDKPNAGPVLPRENHILPRRSQADKPLFFVLVIMVFLACLAAIAAHTSYRAASHWQSDLARSATVQILSQSDGSAVNLDSQSIRTVISLLNNNTIIERAAPITPEQSQDILRPWLGDVSLPEDMNLPILIDLLVESGSQGELGKLEEQISELGFKVKILSHDRWSQDINRTARAAQFIAITALILLLLACLATAGFATQSGLNARRKIIDILSKVGATDHYIARLFTARFGWLGLKAGCLGALLACLVALLFQLASARPSALMPAYSVTGFDLLLISIAPFIAGLTCALAARRTVLKTLRKEGWI